MIGPFFQNYRLLLYHIFKRISRGQAKKTAGFMNSQLIFCKFSAISRRIIAAISRRLIAVSPKDYCGGKPKAYCGKPAGLLRFSGFRLHLGGSLGRFHFVIQFIFIFCRNNEMLFVRPLTLGY